jgi:hypothetical protein
MAVKTFEVKKDEDGREKSRFQVNLVFGTRTALIVDTNYKPLLRTMELPLDTTIKEANFRGIFEHIVEALLLSGNMADDEMASCITFPADTTVRQAPLRGGTN